MPDADESFLRNDAPTVLNPGRGRLRSGFVLRDRFELERVLGEGGMGRVFLAVDREVEAADPYVAIKVLSDGFRQHPDSLSLLRREATNARQLNHPNIMGVYHFDRDGDDIFIVMEYLRGQALNDFVSQHPQGIPFEQAWPLIEGFATALGYMHTHNIVHSDFKPANVFVTDEGTAKVLDLGIARTLDQQLAADGLTRFQAGGVLALTPQYASCEMFTGARADPRDDLYALGCVCYELLTGGHPFRRLQAPEARAAALEPARPPGLKRRQWRALQGLLAFDRAARTASAQAFIEDFSPAARSGNSGYWRAVAVVTMLTLATSTVLLLQDDPDARFIEQQLLEHRNRIDPSIDDGQIANWLEQAELSRDMGRSAFASGDYARGHYFLLESASSARWIYQRVLSSARREADKRTAAQGLLELSKHYRLPVLELLQQGRIADGLDYACRGLRIHDRNSDLRDALRRHRASLTDMELAPCADLLEQLR